MGPQGLEAPACRSESLYYPLYTPIFSHAEIGAPTLRHPETLYHSRNEMLGVFQVS